MIHYLCIIKDRLVRRIVPILSYKNTKCKNKELCFCLTACSPDEAQKIISCFNIVYN